MLPCCLSLTVPHPRDLGVPHLYRVSRVLEQWMGNHKPSSAIERSHNINASLVGGHPGT